MCRWWRERQSWCDGLDISLATIPITGDPFTVIQKLRRSLRDLRDRAAAHQDSRWAGVAFAGMLSQDSAVVFVQHSNIDRTVVWTKLEERWPQIVLADPDGHRPLWDMATEHAAELARRRRGIEPIRLIVRSQVALASGYDEPMPITF